MHSRKCAKSFAAKLFFIAICTTPHKEAVALAKKSDYASQPEQIRR